MDIMHPARSLARPAGPSALTIAAQGLVAAVQLPVETHFVEAMQATMASQFIPAGTPAPTHIRKSGASQFAQRHDQQRSFGTFDEQVPTPPLPPLPVTPPVPAWPFQQGDGHSLYAQLSSSLSTVSEIPAELAVGSHVEVQLAGS